MALLTCLSKLLLQNRLCWVVTVSSLWPITECPEETSKVENTLARIILRAPRTYGITHIFSLHCYMSIVFTATCPQSSLLHVHSLQ